MILWLGEDDMRSPSSPALSEVDIDDPPDGSSPPVTPPSSETSSSEDEPESPTLHRGRGMSVRRGRVAVVLAVLVAVWKEEEPRSLVHVFTGDEPGPRSSISSSETAKEAFCRFLTDDVWDLMVCETNHYAARCRGAQHHQSPRPWHDVDKNELQAFVGVLMLMGICKLPRMEMYWTTTHPLITPGLAEVMPLIV